MHRSITSITGISILVILLAASLFFFWKMNSDEVYCRVEGNCSNNQTIKTIPVKKTAAPKDRPKGIKYNPAKKNPEIAMEDLIQVSYPQPGEPVGDIINVTGIAKGGWYFEGEFPVSLVDEDGNELASGSARAQTQWMKEGWVPFLARLKYSVGENMAAVLVLKKDNPSDMRELDASIEIPVVLEPKRTSVVLYFPSNYFDHDVAYCTQVFPVARADYQTMAIGHLSLEKLFQGPTQAEGKLGYNTEIPGGVIVQQYENMGDTIRLDLSKEFLELELDGFCPRMLIQTQVKETLRQFSGVEEVEITVDGKPIDSLSH